jgi:hypothetical protein
LPRDIGSLAPALLVIRRRDERDFGLLADNAEDEHRPTTVARPRRSQSRRHGKRQRCHRAAGPQRIHQSLSLFRRVSGIHSTRGASIDREVGVWQARVPLSAQFLHLHHLGDGPRQARSFDQAQVLAFGRLIEIQGTTGLRLMAARGHGCPSMWEGRSLVFRAMVIGAALAIR